ncbi:MAG TPA: hypothetical protein VFI11_00835, partial [Anaerolineales bacterium]|nr:hypothetical protein [Anaerolineales bacterium]
PLARYSLDYLAFLAGHARQSVGKELLLAVSGPFVSPSKSVFLFSPPLVLALLSVRGAWKSEWRFVLPALLLPVALALFQGLFYRDLWAGAYGWGLRFMLPALPALLVLCAPLVDAIALQPGRSARWPLWLTLAAGGLIQASGAWVPWITSYQAWTSRGLDPYAPGAAWTARFLLIPGQLERLLDPNTWTLAWLRLRSAGDQRAAVLGFAALVMSFACVVVLVRAPRSIGGRARNVAAASLLAASLILPLWPNLSLLRSDPEWGAGRPQHEQALEWLRSSVTEGDCLLLDSYAIPLWFFWMNRWDQPVPWTSLPFEIPGSAVSDLGESARRIQSRAACSQGRVWYLTSTESPTYGVRHLEGKSAIPADFNLQAVFGQARRVEIWAFSPPR